MFKTWRAGVTAWGREDCTVPADSVGPASVHQACADKPSFFSLCCIAPVLAARVLRDIEVTVGHEQEEGGRWPYAGTTEAIKALGAKHCVQGVTISFLVASLCRGGWHIELPSFGLLEHPW
jgi:enhancing lycopene biosynthesis protein 2